MSRRGRRLLRLQLPSLGEVNRDPRLVMVMMVVVVMMGRRGRGGDDLNDVVMVVVVMMMMLLVGAGDVDLSELKPRGARVRRLGS